jgi:hypothetical protein
MVLGVLAAPARAGVPAGIWKGRCTAGGGQPRAALAFVLPGPRGGAEARLILDDSSLAALSLGADGRGHGTWFPAFAAGRPCTCRFLDIQPKVRFSGSIEAGAGGTVSFDFDEYLSLYEARTELPAMAGGYRSGARQNSLGLDLQCHLRPDGGFRVVAGDRPVLAGALQVPDRERSVFRFSYRTAGPGHPGTGSGLGYFFVDPRTFARTFLVTGSQGGHGLLATFVLAPPAPRR